MLRLIFIACLVFASTAHAARPKLIHQTQTVRAPAGYYFFGYDVAIDGDWAIVAAATPSPQAGQTQNHDALLYHRVNGQWTFDRLLIRRVHTAGGPSQDFTSIAMSNGLAAIGTNPIRIFKRTNDSWAEIAHPFTAPPGNSDHVSGELVWDGNTLLGERRECTSSASWGARIATVGADGTWSPLQRLSGADTDCSSEPSTWDISGDTVVVGTVTDIWSESPSAEMRIFRRGGTQWSQTATVDGGARVGVRGNEMFLSVGGVAGTRVYRNDDTLTLIDRLRSVDAGYDGEGIYSLKPAGDVVLVDRDVYGKDVAGKYQHVATLVHRGQGFLTGDPEISGRRVIIPAGLGANGLEPAVMFHELPATYTPSPVIATGFNGAAPFTPLIGSFSVVTTANGNRVYRQSSTAGEHRALLNYSDWQEQSIEADIRPGASFFSAGLAVRYLDDANFYSVQLRSDNVIELRRMRNGELTLLGQRTLANTGSPNRHVALKIRNTNLQVFVEGREVIWQGDPKPIPHGSAALIGNGTVDYDNVVAAQVGQTFIYDLPNYGWCNGSLVYTTYYTRTGSGTWNCGYGADGSPNIMSQTSTADIARAVLGMKPADDQVVSSRVRMTAVNGQDRWVGLITRYVNESNYYYLSMRSNNTVSLRKLVNGVATVLTTTTLPVTLNTWYDVRLDAVGNELRAVINGVQVLQATDSSHATGRNGMLTYKAGAEYAGYITWQP